MIHRNLLAAFAAASLLAVLPGCGGGGGGSKTTFAVAGVSPPDGASNVPQDSRVRVTFDAPLDPASVAADALQVGDFEMGAVPGTVGLVQDGTALHVEYSPADQLRPARRHIVIVSSALRSAGGAPLAGRTTFEFTTAGTAVDIPPATALRETDGRLDTGRRGHTATLLADGRVLVCGGYRQGTQVTDRAEVWDPSTELFTTLAARMVEARAGHVAVRLKDDRVLLAGGWYEISPGQLNTSLTAEIFDPETMTFASTGDLGAQRADAAAIRLPDGRVLVTGGSRLDGAFVTDLDSAEAFDPAAGTWTPWPATMSHTRAVHAVASLGDGRLLLVGGSDADLRPETMDLATGGFTPFAPAAGDRGRFGAAVALFGNGDAMVCGGEDSGDVLHFDRLSTTLRNTGSPTTRPRAYATATPLDGARILVAGGIDWANGSFVLPTCDLVVEGGIGGSQTYATPVRFPTGMAQHTATLLADGRVLFAGGLNPVAGAPELDGAYVLTP